MGSASASSGIFGDVVAKGPTKETGFAYKNCKEAYKKLVALCRPLPVGVIAVYDDSPTIDDGASILLPPGKRWADQVDELEDALQIEQGRILRADKSQTDKAIGAHAKLVPLMKKLSTMFNCHRQQCALDTNFESVQEAFEYLVDLEGSTRVLRNDTGELCARGFTGTEDSKRAMQQLDVIANRHQVATAEGSALAEDSIGKAVLLMPSTDGWEGAIEVAKQLNFLKQDFPELSTHPLSKIAAIEIKQVAIQRRQGIRKVTVFEGRLRLVAGRELEILEGRPAGEVTEYGSPAKLKVLSIGAGGGNVIPAPWVRFPKGLDASSSLLRAELLDVDASRLAELLASHEDLLIKWRWFLICLIDFMKLREKYKRRPLYKYWDFEDLMIFPKEFVRALTENLMDQLPDEGSMVKDIKAVLETLVTDVQRNEAEIIEMRTRWAEDDDDEEDGLENYEYLELQPDVLHQPPLNPDYLEFRGQNVEVVEPNNIPEQPSIPQPRGQEEAKRFRRPRSRSSSYDSQVAQGIRRVDSGRDGGGGRFSPSATTASQLRGEDRSHSIALQLQRSRQLLVTLTADPDSTKYKIQREKVAKMLLLAEQHLLEETVSESYGDFLMEEMSRAENDCALKDDERDAAEKRKRKQEGDKKDLLAALPRGLGQKFSGLAADYPAFRHYFVEINEGFPPPLAVSHMTSLIACPKLRQRMKIYRTGDEVLKDFDKDFGQSFLNCQTIINSINNLKRATNKSEEMNLILKYRHAKRSLDMNADHEKLLNIPQLIQFADQLLPTTCEDLMRIIQDAEFGEHGSAIEKYFLHLEKVYERSSVLIRNRDARQPPARGGDRQDQGRQGRRTGLETDQRSYRTDGTDQSGGGCRALCKTGPPHRAYNCPLLKTGKLSLKKIRQAKLCTCCLTNPEHCKQGVIKRKDGTTVYLTCGQCKNNKKICNCKVKQRQEGSQSGAASGPPVELNGDAAEGATVTELRTEMSVLVNPNPLGSALEMVDYAVLIAPDGSTVRVRTIYDSGGTDSMIDWRTADKFFHHAVPTKVGVNGANGSRLFQTLVGELRIMNADGTCFNLKAIKSDLSGRAFALKRKFVDIPSSLQHHFGGTFQYYNEIGDLRHYNVSEDYQVQLIIGLDAVALSPRELDRGQDENGQFMLWRSLISNQVLVTGSRKTGWAANRNRGDYVIIEEDNLPVNLLRTAMDLGAQDSRDLFVKRQNLSKIERKFFRHIEDGDQLVPPQPELCSSCQGCEICKDPFRARRENTVIKLMNQLVTFKEAPREQKGGYHIKLIYDPELLARVPEGREAALRRLLSTERQLLKPNMKGALENFNKKMMQCRERGYLVRPEEYDDLSHLQKSYQPVSFALKDEEVLVNSKLPGAPEHKTKARPVIDSSSVAVPGGVSVNGAQYKIPDVHTLKISQILLKLRTAKRFCIGDISEYYFRLWADELTTSLTRILFREGGLGTKGEIIELVSPVASMGMKEISTFAAHVRYRVSLTIMDQDPVAAKQLRDSYCDDVTLFEKFHECEFDAKDEHRCGDGNILASRARLVEGALNKAHLFLGDKWITDANQEVCGDTMVGVAAGGQEKAVVIGSSAYTSALGYRLHLGQEHPPGGSLLWRVHRPQSLNLEPKKRGARPEWAQLANSQDIREYLRTQGVSKASLLSLCSSLFDPLLLAAVFISTARQLFRQVLREVNLTSWKAKVPERYHDKIAQLADNLLEVSQKLKVPRLAVVPNPLSSEAHLHPCGFVTLLIIHDGGCEAGVAAAYVHQMFPYESGSWAQDADFTNVTVTCRLLCAAVKLTDDKGNNCQVSGELLGKFLACQLKENVIENALITFHQRRVCGDSLTVERAIRKTDACYSTWAGRRIASIQRSIDVDESYHVPHEVTDGTVDACTKYQRSPSRFLNERWFEGKGILDVPIQKLPFTDRAIYAQPRIEDLPSQWLSSAAKTFLGLSLPTVVIMKLVVEQEVAEMTLLEQLANKYRSMEKAISVVQCFLKMKQTFRNLPAARQRELCIDKFVEEDYEKISQQLGQRSTRLTQQLALENDEEKRTFTMKGRFGYKARLLANPKSSSFSRLVLRGAHDSHHLTSSARIMAKVGRNHVFTGGALKYLDRLRADCAMCKLLKPEAVKMLLGDPPPYMRGLLPEAKTTWSYQSTDIFGPWAATAFLRAKGTRAAPKKLKIWGLLVFDYASRAIDAQICESYSSDSVILALKAVWSRVGRPKFLNFDAAANLASANDIIGGGDDLEQPSLAEGERLQKSLREQLGNQIEMRPRVPFAPHRQAAERSIQFCKRQLRQMLHHTAGGLLTPLEASALLAMAVAFVNERPLIIHAAPDEQGVLTPWFLSPRSISTFHSQRVEEGDNLEHPLSRRAFQAQQRLELFKGQFNVFYHTQMVKFGHWNKESLQPGVGDICLILDKIKGKAHFLQKFQLGRVSSQTSQHVYEIDFVRQNPEVTAALIKDLRNQSDDWRKRYQVKVSTCTRDGRNLAILCSQAQEGRLRKGFEVDLFMEQPDPRDLVPDVDGGDMGVPNEGVQQQGGDQQGIPGGEQLQRDVPEQQQDTIPDDMVHNELPQGDASENGNGALKAQDKLPVLKLRKKKKKEKWGFQDTSETGKVALNSQDEIPVLKLRKKQAKDKWVHHK